MGFFSRLFGKKEEPKEVHVEEEKINMEPYPSNKLVKFKPDDKAWPRKLAIVLSREENTEKQLKDAYKKDVPFFYKIAVETEKERFMQLKLPVPHLRLSSVSQDELQSFKNSYSSIKLVQEPSTAASGELTTQQEVDEWNKMLIKNKDNDDEESDDGI